MTLFNKAGEKLLRPADKATFDQCESEELRESQVFGKKTKPFLKNIVGKHDLSELVGYFTELDIEVGLLVPCAVVSRYPELVYGVFDVVASLLQEGVEYTSCIKNLHITLTPLHTRMCQNSQCIYLKRIYTGCYRIY